MELTIEMFNKYGDGKAHAICVAKYKGILKQSFLIELCGTKYDFYFEIYTFDYDYNWEKIAEVTDINDIDWAIRGYCEILDSTETEVKEYTSTISTKMYNEIYIQKYKVYDNDFDDYDVSDDDVGDDVCDDVSKTFSINTEVVTSSFNKDYNYEDDTKTITYCKKCGVFQNSSYKECPVGFAHIFISSNPDVICLYCKMTPSKYSCHCPNGSFGHLFMKIG